MACTQRMVANAHYLSDVCWGAAVGMLTATLFYGRGMIADYWNGWESRRSAAAPVIRAIPHAPSLRGKTVARRKR
ncbi:MAG: hypothetical protein QM811_20085 [Pirellulales bacterium]